jgi:hypothetical protein
MHELLCECHVKLIFNTLFIQAYRFFLLGIEPIPSNKSEKKENSVIRINTNFKRSILAKSKLVSGQIADTRDPSPNT